MMARNYDARYEIRRECVGYAQPAWVARFCGAWVGSGYAPNEVDGLINAVELVRDHQRHNHREVSSPRISFTPKMTGVLRDMGLAGVDLDTKLAVLRMKMADG